MAKRLDTDDQAQAILYAAVHGDEAACERFGVSDRSLQRYRRKARDPESELAETVARYAAALDGERRADDFAAKLDDGADKLLALFLAKAADVNPANPEGMRSIKEMFATILEQRTATAYITSLFGGAPPEPDAAGGGDDE